MPFRDNSTTIPNKSSLVRSRSFGGLLNSKSLSSQPPMLGQSFRSPQMAKKSPNIGLSFSRKSPKVPKVPRPQRAVIVFEHIKRGIGECIAATDTDIGNMRASEEFSTSSTGQAKILGIEKQIKAAERYKKKLEFHLSKIEELEDHYKLHQQLREGVKTMAKAYASQLDSPKKSSLFNVKAGYKECSQVMCEVEAQLENMMGSFHCQMQGLIGFARMVPGDVYEVVIRHGHQKWKCKGRIGLTQQTWDSDAFTFKALVGDVFNIKASELRSLSSVTLGHKNCEIKDLFSSHPQLMTVSLNTNGSIKLNLVVTWSPLDGVDDGYSPFNSVSTRVSVPKRRVQSMYVVGSESLSDLSSAFSSPDQSYQGPSSRLHAAPDTNFKLASFMSPLTATPNSRNYALPDHSVPFGPSARPKSIAIMGTIDEMGAGLNGDNRKAELMYGLDMYQHNLVTPQPYDVALDLRRDLSNYTPKAYGSSSGGIARNDANIKFNPLSKSERDLSIYTPRDHSIQSQNPHFALYRPPQFSPTQRSGMYSPEMYHDSPPQTFNTPPKNFESPQSQTRNSSQQPHLHGSQPHLYGSQPHLTAVASANLPHYLATHGQSPYSPRPFSYTEANRFDMSDLAEVLNASKSPPRHQSSTVQTQTTNVVHPSTSRELSTSRGDEGSLASVMTDLKCALEEYQSQFTELGSLEEQVHYLDRLLKQKHSSPHSPKSEDGGISIEDALNAFDFLETEDYIDGYASKSGLEQLEAKCTSLSPESTARTSDSGIECLASRLNEDHGNHGHDMVTTGNTQIDRVLVWHLSYCCKLLDRLIDCGPLKCRQRVALEKLHRQADIIEHLVKTAKKHPVHIKDLQSVLSSITKDKHVKKLWVLCTDTDVLFTSVDKFLTQMDKSHADYVKHKSDISPSLVFRTLLSRILDLPNVDPKVYCPDTIVTMHQVIQYFNKQEKCDVHEILQKLTGELWITRGLKSGNTELILKTLLTLKSTLPPPECLRCVLLLLTSDRPQVRNAAVAYLQSIAGKAGLRRQAVAILIEALEEQSAEMRSGSCIALRILHGKESMEEITHLCHNDHSLLVQQRAKETLLSFGEEGRQAYHDSQLASHGFQGVTMYL